MKQYVIDEIRPQDYDRVAKYLKDNFGEPDMGDIYWVPIDGELLDEIQKSHTECHPIYFAIELVPYKISFELLARTKNRIRCDCIGWANAAQRDWIIEFADSIFERLKIKL